MALKFAPYSFSKISTFTQCPKKFKHQYIEKIYFKSDNIAFEKGNYIHLMLENLAHPKLSYERNNDLMNAVELIITNTTFKFRLSSQEKIEEYKNIFRKFVASNLGKKYFVDYKIISAEEQIGIRLNEDRTMETVNYFDKSATIRGKVDQISEHNGTIHILDWKSGSVPKEINDKQVKLYAWWYMLNNPTIDEVTTTFVYVEHNKEKTATYKRSEMPEFKQMYGSQLKEIEIEVKFERKESYLCKWCDYRQNGLCDEMNSINTTELDMFKVN